MVRIKRVESKEDWDRFIDLPWKIYQNEPHWVPPLRLAIQEALDVNKNPFFKHAYMYPLLALKGDEVVGRVVGIIDDHHNRFHKENTAFFGYFETIENPEVAKAMFKEVNLWASARGMNTLRGPINLSTNNECGLLVDGFEDPPSFMMIFNPPYYRKYLEELGFEKAKDLYAYRLHKDLRFSERLMAQAEKLKQRGKVTVRPINMRKFKDEIEMILDIYNDAWERNWGFVPMEPDEFRHMAKEMKPIVDPELLLIAEVAGEPAGFALTLPDLHQAFRKLPDGKLFPFGLFKLLWHTKGPFKRKTVNRCRILTLGIKKRYQPLGIGPMIYAEYIRRGPRLGYVEGEASWILEDNKPMNRALELMCGERYKTYRIFERPVTGSKAT